MKTFRIRPFGVGWTHAYDIRIEEENPATNYQDTALNYSDRTDFFGAKHKYHRDADGLYSPPAYLFDELSSGYNTFLVNGPIAPLSDDQKSMDGTIKHFTAIGNARVCTSITDRYNNVTVLTYATVVVNGVNTAQLQSVTDPSGRQLVFHWTNVGVPASQPWRIVQVDGPQYSVVYAYGSDGNLSSVTLDASTPAPGVGSVVAGPAAHTNRTTTFGYTSLSGESGLLIKIQDPLGVAENATYPDSHALQYQYTASTGNGTTNSIWVTQIKEPAGVDSGGVRRTISYTVAPVLFSGSTGGSGVSVTALPTLFVGCQLDTQLRNITTSVSVNGFPCEYASTYDSANNVLSTRWDQPFLSSGYYDTFTPNSHGSVWKHYYGLSPNLSTLYDETLYYNSSQYFQKMSANDMNGHKSSFGVGDNTYTNGLQGSVYWVKDAEYGDGTFNNTGTRFAYFYNSYGQKTQEANQNYVVTTYAYGDQWGNLTQVVQDPGTGHLNRTTTMTYDVCGHVLTSTDPNGRAGSFSYNNLGQPLTANFPVAGSTPAENLAYTYAANGRTSSVSDNRGSTSLTYEPGSDRVSSVLDPVDGTLGYTYLLTGERATMLLPGATSAWQYWYTLQTTNQVSQWTLPKDDPNAAVGMLMYTKDDATGAGTGSRTVEYFSASALDGRGVLRSLRSNETYTTGGTPTLVSYLQTDSTFVSMGATSPERPWLASMQTSWHNGNNPVVTLWNNAYTYDGGNNTVGLRTSNVITDNTGATRTETYGYDNLNRANSVNYADGQTQSYTFDPMGNRLSKTDTGGGINGTENYAYNNANMLTSRASNAYTNDMNGNTLTGAGHTNIWDSENRLNQCVYVNGGTTTTSNFLYGADGQRHQMSSVVNGTTTTTNYVLDNSMLVRERRNSANYATYLVGPRGPEYRRDDTTGTVSWYIYDGLGSVVAEINPSGTVTSSRKYDVFGSVRGGTNPSGTSKQKFVGGLGHVSDDETGYVYMRARYMDPTTGRFVSEDHSQNGNNWFAYGKNASTVNIDPDGHEAEEFAVDVLDSDLWLEMWEAAKEGASLQEVLDMFGGDLYFSSGAVGGYGGGGAAAGTIRWVIENWKYGSEYGIEIDAHGMLGEWVADEIGQQSIAQMAIEADMTDIATGETIALTTGEMGAL